MKKIICSIALILVAFALACDDNESRYPGTILQWQLNPECAGIYRSILAPQIQEISAVRNLPQLRARMGCLRTAVNLEVDRLLCAA